jgi:hypothetical protein
VSNVVTVNYATPSQVSLSVVPPAGGTTTYSYQFQRAPDANGSAGTYANLGSALTGVAAGTSYLDLTPAAGLWYWYRVISTDSAGTPVVTTYTGSRVFSGKVPFPGVRPYVVFANGTHALSAERLGQALKLPPVTKAAIALAQVIEGPQTPAALAASLAAADKQRQILSLALDGVEQAITAICTACNLTLPTFSKNAGES